MLWWSCYKVNFHISFQKYLSVLLLQKEPKIQGSIGLIASIFSPSFWRDWWEEMFVGRDSVMEERARGRLHGEGPTLKGSRFWGEGQERLYLTNNCLGRWWMRCLKREKLLLLPTTSLKFVWDGPGPSSAVNTHPKPSFAKCLPASKSLSPLLLPLLPSRALTWTPTPAKRSLVYGSKKCWGGAGQYGFACEATKASPAHCGISEGFPTSLLLFGLFQQHL